jgi:enoyl-[acyl-carrier-protein] reductase (NADH)
MSISIDLSGGVAVVTGGGIANAALFLTSPLWSWMTGQVLSVSGGFTMV